MFPKVVPIMILLSHVALLIKTIKWPIRSYVRSGGSRVPLSEGFTSRTATDLLSIAFYLYSELDLCGCEC